jgi:hypothetical protein
MSVVRAALASLGLFALVYACDVEPAKGDSGFYVASGTCSGTSVACPGLSGDVCSRVAGCQDLGACTGMAMITGEACGARTTFTTCNATPGCFWQANCSGQPLFNCNAVTEEQCRNTPGCLWTSYLNTGGNAPDARR